MAQNEVQDPAIIAHVPFHRWEVTRGGRMADRLMGSPKWWAHRAAIFRQWTLASLARQTDPIDVIVSFRAIDWNCNNPVANVVSESTICMPLVRPYEDCKYPLAPSHADYFCSLFADTHWLVVLSIDSDDCYAEDVVELVRAVKLERGMVMHFDAGWYYDPESGKLVDMVPTKRPPPFFAKVYTEQSLRSPDAFHTYRQKWGFNAYHWQLADVPCPKRMPAGRVLQLIHGANATTCWEDKATQKRLGREILDRTERDAILSRFNGRHDG